MSIILRNVTEADLPIFFEQQLDPEATAMAEFSAQRSGVFYDALGEDHGG